MRGVGRGEHGRSRRHALLRPAVVNVGRRQQADDIQASILRGQLNYPRAKLFKVSTPSGRDGVLYQDFQLSYGKDDPNRLVWPRSLHGMATSSPWLRVWGRV